MSRALPASPARSGAEAFVLGEVRPRGAAQVGSRVAGLRWWRWYCTKAGPNDG
ncbi:hypothetical protein WME75_06500 [Sorangium sp. So ce1014]|uniref:hypothetical protein n=1 Tax=Sorangium sp. So ce1014 TaxID=3133326 RepID=UPI003F6005B4